MVYRFYEITMEKVRQWEEHLLYFRDQVAYILIKIVRDSPPDTKSAEQSTGVQAAQAKIISFFFSLLWELSVSRDISV